jgi:hypothetical protein
MRYVAIDPTNPRVVVTGVPWIPVPKDAVEASCSRCGKTVKIAPSTRAVLNDYPDVPLLDWECANVILPEHVLPKQTKVVGVKGFRQAMRTRSDRRSR